MREMLSVRSRCPVTQAAWDRGLPPPPKTRYIPLIITVKGGGGDARRVALPWNSDNVVSRVSL